MISAFECREHGLIKKISAEILIRRQPSRFWEARTKDHLPQTSLHFFSSSSTVRTAKDIGHTTTWCSSLRTLFTSLKWCIPSYDFVFLTDLSGGHKNRDQPDGLNAPASDEQILQKEDCSDAQYHDSSGKGISWHIPSSSGARRHAGSSDFFHRCWSFLDVQSRQGRKPTQPTTWNCHNCQAESTWVESTVGREWLVLQIRSEKCATAEESLCSTWNPNYQNSIKFIGAKSIWIGDGTERWRGVVTQGKNKQELVQLCEQHHIATMKTVEKIKEELEGNTKGLMQVLRERGLIDTSNLKHFSLTGKKDGLETVDNGTSLRHIMGMCHASEGRFC